MSNKKVCGVPKKVDLVMWTYNGAATLPAVLKRIGEVIPAGSVCQRIISDDNSTDATRRIAESHGWTVVLNKGRGISDNANTALGHVESEFFVSFEQDLLLARDWWSRVPRALADPKVAAASGMRFADKPRGVRRLQQYVAKKYRGEAQLESWLRGREMAAFTLGKTLDNTVYRTAAVREVGGFPKLTSSSGVDTVLAYEMEQHRYQWFVDYGVQSVHLRMGLKHELSHQFWYAKQLPEMWQKISEVTRRQAPPVTRFSVVYRFFMSPFTGLFMAYKTREPTLAYVHPLIRLYYLRGYLASG
ncbi:MAG: glycosyltransferase family 2 protein [Candidatus Bathyarchaeota archaeon]|nr:glycosyltransferase family 2 protein [Candidatus Bathyarchaeota archaeon]